jgi:hypothetical protein
MTLPDERTRALLWAGSFLIKLARDKRLPLKVRRKAVVIARHFPTIEDISLMAQFRLECGLGVGLAAPRDVSWEEGCPDDPLRHSTRLPFPEE